MQFYGYCCESYPLWISCKSKPWCLNVAVDEKSAGTKVPSVSFELLWGILVETMLASAISSVFNISFDVRNVQGQAAEKNVK